MQTFTFFLGPQKRAMSPRKNNAPSLAGNWNLFWRLSPPTIRKQQLVDALLIGILFLMKKKILLVDDSLTVQKVVSLTLDKTLFHVAYAKTRPELTRLLVEHTPELILVSDQVSDIHAPTFPKEVETWLGRTHGLPAFILITSQDIKEMKHYNAVLKKPFSPQLLQNLVAQFASREEPEHTTPGRAHAKEEVEDQAFQKRFNDLFSDEGNLVKETFREDFDREEPTVLSAQNRGQAAGTDLWQERAATEAKNVMTPSNPSTSNHSSSSDGGDLWGSTPTSQPQAAAATSRAASRPGSPDVLSAEDSMAYKALLHQQVESKLGATDLAKVVEQVLAKVLPPIVEKIVHERLDKLLKEQESLVDFKS